MTQKSGVKNITPILVADDNGFNRNIISDILRGAGLDHIYYAKDGNDMLRATIERSPRIVITNSRHPQGTLSGLDFTRMVRAGHRGIDRSLSIVVATDTATAKFIDAARASGVDEMLVRPFTAAALLARVEAVLVRPRQFVESLDYVGPCRRRRMLEEYGGPLRRICDPIDAVPSTAWEAEPNRELMRQRVAAVAAAAAQLAPGDRRQIGAIYKAVEETKQLADEVRDEMMTGAAKSLARYISAIGASRELDQDVISTHIDGMHTLGVLGSDDHAEREALIIGLDAVVNKRLGRAAIAAQASRDESAAA
jgi:CheY-like chemotaxis protein